MARGGSTQKFLTLFGPHKKMAQPLRLGLDPSGVIAPDGSGQIRLLVERTCESWPFMAMIHSGMVSQNHGLLLRPAEQFGMQIASALHTCFQLFDRDAMSVRPQILANGYPQRRLA